MMGQVFFVVFEPIADRFKCEIRVGEVLDNKLLLDKMDILHIDSLYGCNILVPLK